MSKKCCSNKCSNNKCCSKKPDVDTRYTSFLTNTQQSSLYTHSLQGSTSHIVSKPCTLSEIPTGSMVITDPNRCVGYTQIVQASTQPYTGAPNPLQPYVRVGNSIIPSTNNTYDLGAASQRFRAGYFGSAGIDISGLVIGISGNVLTLPPNIRLGTDKYLTISGDSLYLPQIVRLADGTLLGSGGGGSSSSSDLGLEWINRNLIGKSPVPLIGSITVRSSEIYIPWAYPDQIRLTFMDAWVPGMTALNATLEYVTQNAPRQTTVLQVADGTNYVDISANRYTRLTADTHITGIILTSTPGTPTYMPSVTFPDGSVRNVYRFYHPDFAALTAGSQFILNLGYSNFGTPYDTARAVIDIFKTPSPPSAPRNIQQSAHQPYAFTVTYQAPQFVDINDALSTALITVYTIKYSSPGSSRRYPVPLPTAETTVTSTTLDSLLSALTPDSTYAIAITATNSAGLTGVAATAQLVTTTLSPPPLLTAVHFNTTNFNTNNYVINRVIDGSTLTNPLLLAAATDFSLQAFQNGIHGLTTRGDTDTGIASVITSVNGNTVRVNYNGFPAITPAMVTQNGVSVESITVTDTYASSGSESQGFYLTGSNTVSINVASAGITSRSAPYTLSINAERYSTTGGPPLDSTSNNMMFYYDNYPTTAPSFLSANVSIASTHIWSVSGVKLVSSGIIRIQARLENMGRYFYRVPMLTVSGSGGLLVDTLTLTDITSGKQPDKLDQIVDFEKNCSLIITGTSYATAVQVNLTANNVESSKQYTDTPLSIPFMIDMASYNLVYGNDPYYASTSPVFDCRTTGIQTKVGFRISSGQSRGARGETLNPYVTDFMEPIVNYNHIDDILLTEELQISRGRYCSRGVSSSYADYRGTEQNSTVNYSSVQNTGYRFATFYWDVSGFTNFNKVNGLILQLQGLNKKVIINAEDDATINGKRIELFYRFVENLSDPAPSTINTLTTMWINGNSNTVPVTSLNYISHQNNTITRDGLIILDADSDPTECLFNVILPRPIITNCRIYCRIGLPMSEAVSFRNLSASIIIG